ncbi:MAG: hypothetical protein NTV28_12635 [Propionibacteriales bacterium]|nr:hypothetical protein [Propionibacteriales bacterium]
MTPAMDLLLQAVRDAVEDTPYVVDVVDDGFDLRLDLADRRWRTVLGQAGIERTVIHEVRPRGDAVAITDVVRRVDWVAGAPALAGSASVERGRTIALGVEKVWGLDEHGMPVKVADLRFAPQEGRELITLAARQVGLRVALGSSELVGLVFAGIAVGGLVIGGLVVLVLWLTGVLPPG